MRIDRLRPGPRQSRFAAVVLTLAALAAAYFVLLHWWFVVPLLGVDARMHDLQRIHAKYAAAIAERPLLEKRVAELRGGGASVGAFLAESDPSAAAADLIQHVTDVVSAHADQGSGCSIPQKMPVEQDNTNEPFRRVSVSVTLECGIEPLSAVLYDFDRGQPYLFVDDITLARTPATAGGRLEAQLTLSGYVRPGGSQ
jgi:general secretion pathway protein M